MSLTCTSINETQALNLWRTGRVSNSESACSTVRLASPLIEQRSQEASENSDSLDELLFATKGVGKYSNEYSFSAIRKTCKVVLFGNHFTLSRKLKQRFKRNIRESYTPRLGFCQTARGGQNNHLVVAITMGCFIGEPAPCT